MFIALRVAILSASIFLSSCVQHQVSQGTEPTVRPSELIENSGAYDGRHVRVFGYVIIGPERRIVADSRQAFEKNRLECVGLDGANDRFGKFYKGMATVSGIFNKNLCEKGDICLYWCNSTGIVLDDTH